MLSHTTRLVSVFGNARRSLTRLWSFWRRWANSSAGEVVEGEQTHLSVPRYLREQKKGAFGSLD